MTSNTKDSPDNKRDYWQMKYGGQAPALLLFQLGPVQEFIAQARSTRDLWSGSYLLSWLIASAIAQVTAEQECGVDAESFVFPYVSKSPTERTQIGNELIKALQDKACVIATDKALIPNMPNRMLLIVPADKMKAIAQKLERAITTELGNIAASVWEWLLANGGKSEWKQRFDAQVKHFPQITWATREWRENEDWKTAYDGIHETLAARRNVRDFAQWPQAEYGAVKDALSGKEESIGDDTFWKRLKEENTSLFSAEAHRYGAINLVKRLWMIEKSRRDESFIAQYERLNVTRKELWSVLSAPDTQTIAERNTGGKNGYIAVLAMDGDKMGELLSGGNSPSVSHHSEVSRKLSAFALTNVSDIVKNHKGQKNHKGHLIYAGGDDVLAVLPATTAVECAEKLRDAFKACLNIGGAEVSCGIVVGHHKAPLQMLVKEAQRMEHVAKNKYGRGALALSLYKRSGEIIEWGAKWDDGDAHVAFALMKDVTTLTNGGKLSGKFPYALAQLLQPYELETYSDATASIDQAAMKNIMLKEFAHVLERQSEGLADDAKQHLLNLAAKYLDKTQGRLDDFVKLFLAETFINRHRGEH